MSEDLRELLKEARRRFTYDPIAGTFTRRIRITNRKAGTLAGYLDPVHNCFKIQFGGKRYSAHRLAWLMYYGKWPRAEIDHINGDSADNRIWNLRIATRAQNTMNTKRSACNTSGFKGVCWQTARKKWMAQIRINGKHRHLGYFKDPRIAHAAYCLAANRLFGEFANHG